MALVRKIDWTTKEAPRMHAATRCEVSAFNADGERIVQLDTFGTPGRVSAGTISQCVQLTSSSARQLVDILRREFRFE